MISLYDVNIISKLYIVLEETIYHIFCINDCIIFSIRQCLWHKTS